MKYYSNGKLLLTGEYLVLEGAKALALPTKYGQYLEVTPLKTISQTTKNNRLLWQSIDSNDQTWFQSEFNTANFKIKCLELMDKESKKIALKLQEILTEVRKLNPDFLINNGSYHVKTTLDFPKNWGLGTSSTLINNVAQWAKVDAFKLQLAIFGGSAYDIACAQNNTAIIYQLNKGKPIIKPIDFNPIFKENLFFVFLNTKKNSRSAIKSYQKNKENKTKSIEKINFLTQKLTNNSLNLTEFEQIIEEHEQILASILGINTIKKQLFSDYFGAIKSLGAWEGDFILVTGNANTPAYFAEKGFATILQYDKMIK